MFQPVSFFIGLRYAQSSKGNAFISFISFFSIAGITLGLMSLITVSSVMNGFEQSLKSAMLELIPHIQVKTDKPNQVKALIKELKMLDGIKRAQPYVTSDVILQTNNELVGVRLQGVFSGYQSALEKHVQSGELSRLKNEKYTVALSRYLANKLDVSVGEQIRIILPDVSSYSVLGRVPMQRLFRVVVIYNSQSEMDSSLAFAHGQSLERLMQRHPQHQMAVSITLDDAFMSEAFLMQNKQHFKGLKVDDWKTQQGALFSAVAMEKRVMSLLLGLIVVVAIFNILSSLSMMVREKQGEVAILQTLGLTPTKVSHVFMIQGLYNGVIGTLLGVFFGLLLSHYINEFLDLIGLNLLGGVQLPILISPMGVALMASVSILLSFAAALYPANRAAKVLPAEVLRYE